jgi:hypothetical protein
MTIVNKLIARLIKAIETPDDLTPHNRERLLEDAHRALEGRKRRKRRYRVVWSKSYWSTGELVVEAHHEGEAGNIVLEKIGDLAGKMEYNPREDEIMSVDEVSDEST